jgi:pimeloyl-ACP methyl ester carboxylesterase
MHPYVIGGGLLVSALAISALVNAKLAKKAERDNPAGGAFVEVDGVRLHYVERGRGQTVVLLHGNGSMVQDLDASGLIARASEHFQVIAFDRPGFGHSQRPRGTLWSPEAQAKLFSGALEKIGVTEAVVFGHSWGASAAMALGLYDPQRVKALVLASGYYYPTPRPDALLLSSPAIPIVGDVIRYSISPMVGRLIWPLVAKKLFAPETIPAKFARFPKEMAFRPSQIRAAAAESAMIIPNAYVTQRRYKELAMPVVLIAGEHDQLVDIEAQSSRLHRELPQSTMHRVRGAGHMVHQTATEQVVRAIEEAAKQCRADAARAEELGHSKSVDTPA